MNDLARRSCCTSSGHTLLEMLLSLVLLSIVMASVGSAVMFASHAVPNDDSAVGSLMSDSALLSQIAEDLASAQYVIEQTGHAMTVVVADRTGDDIPDRIRYAWSGVAGAPLFYQLNDDAAVQIVDAMAVFDLTYASTSVTEALPTATYLGSETLIASFDSDVTGSDESVEATQWYGQSITAALTAEALGFVATRTELYAGWDIPKDGQVLMSIRDFASQTPGENTYASAVLEESSLIGATYWTSHDLGGGSIVPVGESIAMTATYVSGSDSALRLRSNSSGSGRLATSDSGGSWVVDDGKSLVYRLYGREAFADKSAYEVTKEHLAGLTLSLQSVADGRSPLNRSIRLMQAPPILAGFAQTGFEADPVGMDLDADVVPDWSHSAGTFPANSLSGGLWTSIGELTYDQKSLETADVIRIRTRMRSSDTLGPTIYGPYTFDSKNELLPLVAQLRDDGAGGQELVLFDDLTLASERMVLSGLPAGLVDVELTLIPDADLVSIKINRQPVASVVLERVADPGTIDKAVSFGSGGGVAIFDFISVEVGGTYSASSVVPTVEINVGGIGVNVY